MIPSQGHPCGPIPSVDHGPQASLLSSWSSSLFKLQIDIDIYLYVGIYMASTLRGKTIHRFLNHFSRYISSCCAVPPFQSPCLLALLLSNDLVYMHLFEVDISYQVPRKDVFSSVRLVCCQTKAFVELACVCMDWALFGSIDVWITRPLLSTLPDFGLFLLLDHTFITKTLVLTSEELDGITFYLHMDRFSISSNHKSLQIYRCPSNDQLFTSLIVLSLDPWLQNLIEYLFVQSQDKLVFSRGNSPNS